MRLSADQTEAIKQKAGHRSGLPTVVRRFGLAPRAQRGFTLTELVTIIVILGIISAVAAPRFFDINVFQSRGAADQVRAALRYGQKVAIAQHRDVNVNISAGADSDCGVALTAGDVDCVIINSVVVVPALPQTVTFNALGQRVNATAAITVGGSAINIEAETGYVR